MSDGGGRDRFLTEILEQPDALRRAGAALVAQRDRLDHLAAFAASPGPIVLTGMGGSLDACHAAATALAAAGIMATVRGASELVHFGLPALAQGGILVVVSQSGESAEIVRLAEAVRHTTGRPIVVAVANGADNPLVRLADIPIDTRAGEELAPSTKSFAACLVSLSGIVRALAGAKMGALLLAEAVGLAAASHETGDFRHGPLELAGPGLAVALLALEDATLDLDLALADELAGAGSPLLVVSRDGVGPAEAIRVATGPLDRMVAPAVALVPLQLLAWRLAVRAGRTPGEMLRGSKVTRCE
ncbi:MAG: SIS domain-containing protein [Chloroflexota bacterium]